MRVELKTALPLVLLIGNENKGNWLMPAGLKSARVRERHRSREDAA